MGFFSWGDDVIPRDDHSKEICFPPITFSRQDPPVGGRTPRVWEGPALGGLAAPQTPLLTRGASPPGPPDLHGEGTEPYIK